MILYSEIFHVAGRLICWTIMEVYLRNPFSWLTVTRVAFEKLEYTDHIDFEAMLFPWIKAAEKQLPQTLFSKQLWWRAYVQVQILMTCSSDLMLDVYQLLFFHLEKVDNWFMSGLFFYWTQLIQHRKMSHIVVFVVKDKGTKDLSQCGVCWCNT